MTEAGKMLGMTAGHMCNCIGPQNGQPKCPCMMRGLIQRDGRWIQPEVDLGPVNPSDGAPLVIFPISR